MKINSVDTRRVHTQVTIRNGERTEDVTWGDIRSVGVVLDPGEVPDMLSEGYRDRGKMFRPETAHLQWQRNTYWGVTGWKANRHRPLSVNGWVLTNAGIRGTNIRKDGSVGKVNECALYANDDGYGISHVAEPPNWYAELLAEHDPNRTGSLLDTEDCGHVMAR